MKIIRSITIRNAGRRICAVTLPTLKQAIPDERAISHITFYGDLQLHSMRMSDSTKIGSDSDARSRTYGYKKSGSTCRMLAPIYSARDSAITQRPTSTALLAIDSEDRFRTYDDARLGGLGSRNGSPYDFTITRNESIMNGFFTRLGVTEVVFPWTIPNINRRSNSIIVGYQVGAGPLVNQTLTLPESFMLPSQIASAIQAIVRAYDASLAGFTMTYGVQTTGTIPQNLPVFEYKTNNAGVTIGFAPIPPGSYGFDYARSKQLFDVLGFSAENTSQALYGMGGTTFCQSIRYVDIVCSQLTGNQALKDTMTQEIARDVLCRIYLNDAGASQSTTSPSSSTFCPTGCAPFTVYRDFSTPKQIMWLPNQPVPGYLRFEVFDDAGVSLSLFDSLPYPVLPAPAPPVPSINYGINKTNWSMTLLVTEN